MNTRTRRRPESRHHASFILLAGLGLAATHAPAPARAAVESGKLGQYAVDREAGGAVHVLRAADAVCGGATSPEAAAMRFLEQERVLLDLPADLSGLEVTVVQESLTGFHVRYGQRVDGLPVWGAALAVHLDLQHCVVQVDRAGIVAGPVASVESISEAEALVIARQALVTVPASDKFGTNFEGLGDVSEVVLNAPPSATRVVVHDDRRKVGRAAYLVSLWAQVPHGHWEVVVDADSGKVLGSRSLTHYSVDGSGQVFQKASPCISQMNPSLTDGADADAAVPPAAYATVTLNQLNDPVGGLFRVEGPYSRTVDIEAPAIVPPTSPTSTFTFTRNPDGFEAVNVYYYIDLTQRYMQSLGFTPPNRTIFATPIRIDVKGVNGADNSHYSDSPLGAGYLAFGDGGVDDGEDADVVIHEYGHAIHHNQVINWSGSCEGDAMGEGFGDYLAGTMHAPFNFDNACIMMWDATSYRSPAPPNPCLRRMDCVAPGESCGRSGGWVWTGTCTEEHDDGEIWSQALWNCHQLIGRDTFNRVLLESHFAVPAFTGTFRDAVLALFDADRRLNACANCANICQVMIARGFITNADCPGGAAGSVQSHSIDDAAPRGDGDTVAEPGEMIVTPVTLRNDGTVALTNVSATLSSDQPGFISITTASATYPNIAVAGSASSNSPHYAWTVAANTPCGQVVNFTLNITAAEGIWTGTFSETIGRLQSASYTGPPVLIPDDATQNAQANIAVSSPGMVSGLTVRVGLTHSWVGDLLVQLRSPSGTTITLLDRPGFDVVTNPDGCDDQNMDVTFDDAATTTAAALDAVCAGDSSPWYVGQARPVQALSALNGQSLAGTWTLIVTDQNLQDEGTIDTFTLGLGFQCGPGGGCTSTTSLPGVKAAKLVGTPNARLAWAASADPCHGSYKVYRSTVPGMRPSPPPGTWPSNPAFNDITSLDIDGSAANTSFDWAPGAGLEYLKVIDVGSDGNEGPNGSF